jgi:CubicO group peptidase (beta-lactamase class C family)
LWRSVAYSCLLEILDTCDSQPSRAIAFYKQGTSGLAEVYSAFAVGGRELGLRKETLDLLAAPAIRPTRGFYDECMKADGIQFSLGFRKSTPIWPFGSARSFGAPGSGGSLGFADPEVGVGYAYVTSQSGSALTGDPRDVALREALYAALRSS